LLIALKARFGGASSAIVAELEQVTEHATLVRLIRPAAVCPTLQAFEAALREELFSSCGKRRSPQPSA
jgi:hypothetical protein